MRRFTLLKMPCVQKISPKPNAPHPIQRWSKFKQAILSRILRSKFWTANARISILRELCLCRETWAKRCSDFLQKHTFDEFNPFGQKIPESHLFIGKSDNLRSRNLSATLPQFENTFDELINPVGQKFMKIWKWDKAKHQNLRQETINRSHNLCKQDL